MKKITLGYGYRFSKESVSYALSLYEFPNGLHKTKASAIKQAKFDKKEGLVSKNVKPRFFRIVIETE